MNTSHPLHFLRTRHHSNHNTEHRRVNICSIANEVHPLNRNIRRLRQMRSPTRPFLAMLPDRLSIFRVCKQVCKENGFGITRRNGYLCNGKKRSGIFTCVIDWGTHGPRPSEGTWLRQRKSRTCGCQWKVIAESVGKHQWLLRQHQSPEQSQTIGRASDHPHTLLIDVSPLL